MSDLVEDPMWSDIWRELEYAIQEWKAEQSAIDRGIYPDDTSSNKEASQ